MNNLKQKILSFALATSVVLSSTSMAFAGSLSNIDKLNVLSDLGIITGEGNGVIATQTMTRYRAFVMQLKMMGKYDEMNNFAWEGKETFKDINAKHSQFIRKLAAYLKAHPEFGIEGDHLGNLNPMAPVSAREYMKMMLVRLGYVENKDFTWASIPVFAQSLGLVESASEVEGSQIPLTTIADFTYDTLTSKPVNSDKTLAQELGLNVSAAEIKLDSVPATSNKAAITISGSASGLDKVTVNGKEVAVKNGKFETEVTLKDGSNTIIVKGDGAQDVTVTVKYNDVDAPEVVDVQPAGLKQVEVTFNEEVDKDSAEVLANYDNKFATAKLQSDKKTVVLTLASAAAQNDKIKFDIEDIKDLKGNKMDKESVEVKMVDREVPEVEEVSVKGNQMIQVTFSELVQVSESNFELVDEDGNRVERIKNVEVDGRNVKINFRKAIDAGNYILEVNDVKDYANLVMLDAEFDVTIVEDEDAPSATLVSATDTKVTVEFNEDIKTALKDIEAEWKSGSKKGSFDKITADDDNDRLITFELEGGKTIPLSGITLYIWNVEDYSGNSVDKDDAIEIKVDRDDIEIDTIRPEVESIKQDGKNTFIITFSEDVQLGTVTVFDEDDEEIDVKSIAYKDSSKNKKEIKVVLDSNDDLYGTFTVEIEDFADMSTQENEMIPDSFEVKLEDSDISSDVTSFKALRTSNSTIDQILYIQFPEKMNESSVENENNYKVFFGGKWVTIHKDADITLLADEKTVKIEVKDWFNNSDVTPAAIDGIQIFNVKDESGNELDGTVWLDFASNNGYGVLSLAAPEITAVKATAKDKAIATVSGSIDEATLDADDFYFQDASGNKYYVDDVTYNSTKDELTFIMDDEFPTDVAGITLKLAANVSTENVFEQAIELASGLPGLVDEIKPEVTVTDAVYATAGKSALADFILGENSGAEGLYVILEASEAIDVPAGADAQNLLKDAFTVKKGSKELAINKIFEYTGNNTEKYNKNGVDYVVLFITADKDGNAVTANAVKDQLIISFNEISVKALTITDAASNDNVLAGFKDGKVNIQ
ncbi:hypothetical protein GND95_03180 [Defluviitalea raffinosedens]|uniref:SLH domain-containing protein n=1 Tax=Defluviitalea raffinosedens TaxID=1450156 RepID=A0A7C8HFQ5_9FIRM|nr:Ig-like domain-containing protein [Defluviitalea raffinosedens]KAE9636143.1 hypothetical protein GND95_03180 [Defluviitalea raffinosedens]